MDKPDLHYISFNDFKKAIDRDYILYETWVVLDDDDKYRVYSNAHSVIDTDFSYVGTPIVSTKAFPRSFRKLIDSKNFNDELTELFTKWDNVSTAPELSNATIEIGKDILRNSNMAETLEIYHKMKTERVKGLGSEIELDPELLRPNRYSRSSMSFISQFFPGVVASRNQ